MYRSIPVHTNQAFLLLITRFQYCFGSPSSYLGASSSGLRLRREASSWFASPAASDPPVFSSPADVDPASVLVLLRFALQSSLSSPRG